MTTVTVELPGDLAQRLQPLSDRLPDILEMGLRQWRAAGQPGFQGTAEILELLATLPSPEEILALCPSEALQARVQTLLEKNRAEGLSPAEEQEWQQYEYLEHLVRMAKARALLRQKGYASEDAHATIV
jgi:hypothetical protein